MYVYICYLFKQRSALKFQYKNQQNRKTKAEQSLSGNRCCTDCCNNVQTVGGNFCLHDTKKATVHRVVHYACRENKRHKIKKYQKQNKTKSHKRNFEFNFDFDFESSSNCDQFLFADKRKMMMWLSCVCNSFQYPLFFTLYNCCNPRPLPLLLPQLMSIARRPRQTAAIWSDTFFVRIARWKIVQAKKGKCNNSWTKG